MTKHRHWFAALPSNELHMALVSQHRHSLSPKRQSLKWLEALKCQNCTEFLPWSNLTATCGQTCWFVWSDLLVGMCSRVGRIISVGVSGNELSQRMCVCACESRIFFSECPQRLCLQQTSLPPTNKSFGSIPVDPASKEAGMPEEGVATPKMTTLAELFVGSTREKTCKKRLWRKVREQPVRTMTGDLERPGTCLPGLALQSGGKQTPGISQLLLFWPEKPLLSRQFLLHL